MANWIVFLVTGLVSNLIAMPILVLSSRAETLARLAQLQKRAIACLLVVNLVTVGGIAAGAFQAHRATRGATGDPTVRAGKLADGISQTMNGLAFGIVSTPLPLAAALLTTLRARRLARNATAGR